MMKKYAPYLMLFGLCAAMFACITTRMNADEPSPDDVTKLCNHTKHLVDATPCIVDQRIVNDCNDHTFGEGAMACGNLRQSPAIFSQQFKTKPFDCWHTYSNNVVNGPPPADFFAPCYSYLACAKDGNGICRTSGDLQTVSQVAIKQKKCETLDCLIKDQEHPEPEPAGD